LTILNLTTDGFIFKRPRKSVTADKIQDVVESITQASLPKLEDHVRERLMQAEPKQKRLKTTDLFPIRGCDLDDPVFRVVVPQARQHLRGDFDLGKVTRHGHRFSPNDAWNDIATDQALALVMAGQSIFVRGIAGTGKSHLIRETLIPALEARGKNIAIIAKTHNAAMVAGGDTADHWVWKHVREGGTGIDVVWVDEVSMLNAQLLCDLNHASFRDPPIQWILSGDFNQYEPFFNTLSGVPVTKSFEDCELLHALAGGNRLTLTECKRSEQFLFDWYSSIARGGFRHGQRLQQTVAEARQAFPASGASGFIPGTSLAPTNLVLSHRLREMLNKMCNEASKPSDAEHFTLAEFGIQASKEDQGSNLPQDAYFWLGLRVVANCRGRKLRNGRAYEIVKLAKDVTIRPCTEHSDQSDASNDIMLSRAKLFRAVRLPHAVTYASAQGLTISGLVALHDTSHVHFDWRKLFVGLSRATGRDRVIVY
jgi:hypothetical protein